MPTSELFPRIGGIPVRIKRPGDYSRALASALEKNFLDWGHRADLLRELHALIGSAVAAEQPSPRESAESIPGWWAEDRIMTLFDREWLDSPCLEFPEVENFLRDSSEVLNCSQSVFVSGAGLCRISEWLASLPTMKRVISTDLSWQLVYLGRQLCNGNSECLPPRLLGARRNYRIDQAKKDFIPFEERFPVVRSRGTNASLEFEVQDVFTLQKPDRAEAVLLPYLLDAFTGSRVESILFQVGRAMRTGQSLVLLVTLLRQRDPARITRMLRATGLEITGLARAERLPYSFSEAGFGFTQQRWDTVLIEARKIADFDASLLRTVRAPHPGKPAPIELPEDSPEWAGLVLKGEALSSILDAAGQERERALELLQELGRKGLVDVVAAKGG